MFGRKRREESEALLRDARDRLDASARQAARLVDAMTALNATIGAEIERNHHLEQTADATVNALQQALASQSGNLAAALEQVASSYAQLGERIEAERIDRGALVEAIRQLAPAPAPLPTEPARPRVLGGTVFASNPGEPDLVPGDTVDLVSDEPFPIGTSVCCRFGDQWINGVEIVEAVGNPVRPAYRLRRHQDGYVLPALFGARDLRPAHPPEPTRAKNEGPDRNYWARS